MRLGNLSNSVKIYENIDKDHNLIIYTVAPTKTIH